MLVVEEGRSRPSIGFVDGGTWPDSSLKRWGKGGIEVGRLILHLGPYHHPFLHYCSEMKLRAPCFCFQVSGFVIHASQS